MGEFVALLRAVNVGGQRKVPMAELRLAAEGISLRNVRTFIASGNLIFSAADSEVALEEKLEEAIAARFGFLVDVMVRSAEQWEALIAANPFPEEADAAPKFLMLYIGKEDAAPSMQEGLEARAAPEEKVEAAGAAVWIFFANGGGRSKLASGPKPGLWTGRNWRTVLTIGEMLRR